MANEAKQPKRRYVPLLPQPNAQNRANVRAAGRRSGARKRRDRIIDEVLGDTALNQLLGLVPLESGE